MDVNLQTVTRELSRRYPEYPEAIAGADRRKVDWELCGNGIFSEMELLQAYAKGSGLDIFEESDIRPFTVLSEVSPEYFNTWNMLAVRREGSNTVLLLFSDPYLLGQHRYFFRKLLNIRAELGLMRRSTLERLSSDLANGEEQSGEEPDVGDEESLRSLASEARVVRLVNEMLLSAVEVGASDIHVEPESEKTSIRFRVDGVLREYASLPLTRHPAIASRIKLIGGLNIAESRLPQDGRTNIQLARTSIDVRISTMPTINGEGIVLRLLEKGSLSFDLGEIGMLPEMEKIFNKLIQIPYGMILVVGPTGSGKTTTLYSVISKLNNSTRKIITIEDPVEYRMEQLSQIQVNPKIGLTFANGLRHIVRQDPDIILVGEIRDQETADIAINAALTGHLVLSTLHTNDAAGAIGRLLDMGMESFLVSSVLYGVLSQRLVRKICTRCHGSGQDPDGGKCTRCAGWGYAGRTGIFELLTIDNELREAINRRASSTEIVNLARGKGMKLLLEDGLEKVKLGITTESEVRRSALEVDSEK